MTRRTRIVLVDLDLTLVDKQYNLTVPLERVREVVERVQGGDVVIGLNSDSGFATLTEWRQKLGLNGPIISERGARIWLPDQPEQIELTSPAARLFPRLRERLCSLLQNQPGLTVLCGNANQIQASRRPTDRNGKVLIINDQRQRSLSFFARSVDIEGNLTVDQKLLESTVEAFRESTATDYVSIWKEKDEDVNPNYGIYILHLAGTQKNNAVVRLLDMFDLPDLWMIGDSSSDLIDDQRVNHVAVANARAEFKEKARVITRQSLTEGVIEFLQKLV